MRRLSHYTSVLRRTLSLCVAMSALVFMASCGEDPVPPTPTPPTPSPTPTPTPEVTVSEVTKWMDERLQKEYMWLDEYNSKHSKFDMSLEEQEFLNAALRSLTTNTSDGGGSGPNRYIYSYIQQTGGSTKASTRASFPTVNGYGIEIAAVVGVSNIEGYEKGNYGIIIEHVYPGSAAAEAGLDRSDVILQVNGNKITESNYENYCYNVIPASSGSVTLTLRHYVEEEKEYEYKDVELTASLYEPNPVAYGGILDIDPEKYNIGDKKVGYLTYLSFDADFDDALVEAMRDIANQGATDMILDLRANSGGHVSSSVLLASMLLDESYVHPEKIYARLKHNPKNEVHSDQELSLEKNYTPSGQSSLRDLPNIGIKKLYVICSEWTASASEMVIVGLRGLDVEVTLIGTHTEGKNCGMEVTTKTFDGATYEFAPITFMNENGKGFSDYGEGIAPDVDFVAMAENSSISKTLQSMCAYYPIPYTTWGDVEYDIALEEAVMQICGSTLFKPSAQASMTRAAVEPLLKPTNIKMEKRDVKKRGMFIHVDEPAAEE